MLNWVVVLSDLRRISQGKSRVSCFIGVGVGGWGWGWGMGPDLGCCVCVEDIDGAVGSESDIIETSHQKVFHPFASLRNITIHNPLINQRQDSQIQPMINMQNRKDPILTNTDRNSLRREIQNRRTSRRGESFRAELR